MCQFLETIRVENRVLQHLEYHQQRMERTVKEFFPLSETPVLTDLVAIPDWIEKGTYKCRVIFSEAIEKIEFEKYFPRRINTLKIVKDDEVDYSFKFANRSKLNQLLSHKGACDDILIVKNGLVTDTSYSNILLYDGSIWVTPDHPLLPGTCRQRLLDNHHVTSREITINDLRKFRNFMLINAMLDFDVRRAVQVSTIKF
ncbi:MAG: aminotransferase class IV [Bacteroidales bacterium]|nr:aminotransferase class IV [Bacteroidales bacterium]